MVIESRTAYRMPGWRDVDTEDLGRRPPSILLLGDPLPCLSAMQDLPGVDVGGELRTADARFRAVVVGVELSEPADAVRVKGDLQARTVECVMLAQQQPTLQHIILVVGSPDQGRMSNNSRDTLLAACETASEAIQAEVEQRVGTYVIVTIILAGRCNDPGLLARRLVDRAIQTSAADASSVVLWDEIRVDSIGDVGLNQYI